jgi:alpha-glucosidase
VDVHEPIKDTGERRTWPNMMSREGARGMEFNAWSAEGGKPAGARDDPLLHAPARRPDGLHAGIFDLTLARSASGARKPWESRPRTRSPSSWPCTSCSTRPLQMAGDIPESYAGHSRVPVRPRPWGRRLGTPRWCFTGRIGDHVRVARKARGRDEWFVGAISDEEARTLDVSLAFLPRGRRYVAEIYADGPGASWRDNPTAVAISSRPVDAATRLRIAMAPGGGQAIRLRPANR